MDAKELHHGPSAKAADMNMTELLVAAASDPAMAEAEAKIEAKAKAEAESDADAKATAEAEARAAATVEVPVKASSAAMEVTHDPSAVSEFEGSADKAPEPAAQNATSAAAEVSANAEVIADTPDPAPAPDDKTAGVSLLETHEHLKPGKGGRKLMPLAIAAALVVVSGGGAGAYYMLKNQPAPESGLVAATATPTVAPTASPTPAVTPAPTAAPTPAPTPAPAPQEVTAPAVAPTADHPQMVPVTSSSGLWLRSSPSSASKKNIIGWLPKGAQVSVDSVGSFWWHGTYNGKTGYFAVNYTK
jgi:hypothetical protein